MSLNIPFCPISPICKMFFAMSHWSGSRPHWTLRETSHGYPAVARSSGDSAVISQQDCTFMNSQQVTDWVDVRVGQPKAHDVGLGGS